MGQAVGGALGLQEAGFAGRGAVEQFGVGLGTGLAAGAAAAVMRGGRVAVQQVAVDAFGNALGSSIAEASQSSGGVDWGNAPDQSDAETARLNRYEDAALSQEAANNRTLLNAANQAADGDYYGPAWNGGKAFASNTTKRRQEIAVQDASSRVEQGLGTAQDIKLLKTVGWFPSPQRLDSSLTAFTPSGMTKVDGSPVTYSFNERTGQAYWDLGEDNLLRAIPKAFRSLAWTKRLWRTRAMRLLADPGWVLCWQSSVQCQPLGRSALESVVLLLVA